MQNADELFHYLGLQFPRVDDMFPSSISTSNWNGPIGQQNQGLGGNTLLQAYENENNPKFSVPDILKGRLNMSDNLNLDLSKGRLNWNPSENMNFFAESDSTNKGINIGGNINF
jgi:hypothetical protein